MKRLLCLLLAFTLLMACACLPAGAEHTHKWKDVDIIQQPTCTTPGSKIQGCTVCGVTRDVMIPALGHEFSQQVYIGHADCTHYGAFYWVCERCGAHSAIGNDKPLGHDWDEGVITTPPQGFTPGVRTYTCKRDPSHTYTEEVDPIEWVFATLENNIEFPDLINSPIDLKDIPPLVITKQPVGGYVARETDEGFELTIEVEGGEPPYSYEWHRGSKSSDLEDTATQLANLLGGLLGFSQEEIDAMMADVHDKVVGEDEPSCHVFDGGYRYWCEVTDNKKQHATSDEVIVDYDIDIWIQPGDRNLTEGSPAYLECKAYGGSGEYTYEWFRWNDSEADDYYMGSEMPLPVTEPGEYYCIAMDAVTGDTAESADATVYEAPLLTVEVIEGNQTLPPNEKGTLTVKVTGGVPPYEGKFGWSFHGVLPTDVDDPNTDGAIFTAETEAAGWYTFSVKDSMVNLAYADIYRYDTPIKIVKQPESGILPADGSALPVRMEVADCTLPLTYEFYLNHNYVTQYEVDDYSVEFGLYNPGLYYFKITDADGRYTFTDTISAEKEEFRVVEWTPHAELSSSYNPVDLKVKVAGGKEPYTFYWLKMDGDYGTLLSPSFNIGSDGSHIYINVPGKYECDVQDANGDYACSKTITVTYNGTKPLIIEQPKDVIYEGTNAEGPHNVTLTCRAVTSEGKSDGLKYVWEWRGPDTSWYQLKDISQTIDVASVGFYRCCVIDNATEEYTFSNIAVVDSKMHVTEVEIESWSWLYSMSYNSTQFKINIEGGAEPYTVLAYMIGRGGNETKLMEAVTLKKNQLGKYVGQIPIYEKFSAILEDGLDIYSEKPALYYFVVLDSYDQMVQTETVEVQILQAK